MIFKDINFGNCVAAIEHKHYPIYAIQFHPEKMLYDDSGLYNLEQTEIA